VFIYLSTQCKNNQAYHNLHFKRKSCFLIIFNFSFLCSAETSGEGTSHETSEESSSHGVRFAVTMKEPTISLRKIDNEKVKFLKAFETLLKAHPLSLSGKIPKVRERRNVSQDFQRKLYTYWGKKQFELRVEHARGEYFTEHIVKMIAQFKDSNCCIHD